MIDPIFKQFDAIAGTKTPQAGAPAQSRADEIRAMAKQSTPQPKEGLFSKIDKGVQAFGQGAIDTFGSITGLGGLDKINVYKPGGLINPQTGKLQQPFDIKGTEEVVGKGIKAGLTLGTLGSKTAATLGGKVVQGLVTGGGFGTGQAMEEKKSTGDVAKSAAIGSIIGGSIPLAAEGAKWTVGKVPKLLSYLSDTPEKVLQRNYDNPALMKTASDYIKSKGPTGVLSDTQGAVKNLRKDLTQQWEEGSKAVIAANKGKTEIFDSKIQKLLKKTSDTFGFDLPQNMDNVSVNEALKLNTEINTILRKGKLQESAEGVLLRKTSNILDGVVKKFKGAGELLSNYAGEKKTLDAADMLVRAYKTSNPIAQRTAMSRLLAVYNENAPSFLSAMKDLEAKTGVQIMDKLAALKSSGVRQASEVIKGRGILETIRGALAVWADNFARGAGRTSKTIQAVSPAVSKVGAVLGGEAAGQLELQ